MRGISLACGCIYTLYMYIAGRHIHMYIRVQVYMHGRQSDRKIKLSCETIAAAVSRNRLLDQTGGTVDFDVGPESTYGFITDRNGLAVCDKPWFDCSLRSKSTTPL